MAFPVNAPVIGAALPAMLALPIPAHMLYVAAHGTFEAATPRDGSWERPFATVIEARDSLRRVRRAPGEVAVVQLRGGDHFLLQNGPLRLDQRDSGILWSSAPGEHARLSGAFKIPVTSFVAVPSVGAHIYVSNLLRMGLNASMLGAMASPFPTSKAELFYGGRPMRLARDPNVASNGSWMWAGYENTTTSQGVDLHHSFIFADAGRGALWRSALNSSSQLWLHAYLKNDWRDEYLKIDSIEPFHNATFRVTRDPTTKQFYPFTVGDEHFTAGSRFYAVNALELLDAPGEYYIDVDAGELYFYPPSGAFSPDDDILLSVLDHAVDLNGTRDTSFVHLSITAAKGHVVLLNNTANVTVLNSTITNGGMSCLYLEGTASLVKGNAISGCGHCGVEVHGGDRYTLARGNLCVVGNAISSYSRVKRTYTPGIRFGGVGIYVANNTISHAPHNAIQGGGNDNLFEFNHISHVVYETTDAGAFYVFGSWSERGNVVRFNSFDTIKSTQRLAQKTCWQTAIYLDDQMSGWDVYGNTIINASNEVLISGGRDNRIHANLFLDSEFHDIYMDDRGLGVKRADCQKGGRFDLDLQRYKYKQAPWATRYPELPFIFDDASFPCLPVKNAIEDNRYCHTHSATNASFARLKTHGHNIDVDKAMRAWHSHMSFNVEDCASVPHP